MRLINKWKNRLIVFLLDTIATIISLFGAHWVLSSYISLDFFTFFLLILTQCCIFVITGLYRGIWQFASIPDLVRILRAAILSVIACSAILIFSSPIIFSHFSIVYGLLLVSMLSGSRLLYRSLHELKIVFMKGKRTLIVGAGSAADSLIRDLKRSFSIYEYKPIAIVDDNPDKQGCEIQGIRVIGKTSDIQRLIVKKNIQFILIAIPSANSTQMRKIVNYCEASNIPFKTLPGLKAITDLNIKTSILREIQLEDLLGREETSYDIQRIQQLIFDKTILITGGGGSIGSELCRQIAQHKPKHLIIIDKHEYNLYEIELELQNHFPDVKVHAFLCCVTDRSQMKLIFQQYQPELVFHVAAYKHVPLLEKHVRSAMFNNIIGTQITAELADEFNVKSFVLISTDKAVNPSNIMGSTKRAAELCCQALNHISNTRYITVRFGNVLDSAGSVIPLFRRQIANGGPVTITHPDITRYFMTIPEAALLILQSVTINTDADIFVLDMGEPIKIQYLAEQMIKLSGKKLGEQIKIRYTGLRPGEKLYEELFYGNEILCHTEYPKIKQAKAAWNDHIELNNLLKDILHSYYAHDEAKLKALLCKIVPSYCQTIEKSNAIFQQYEGNPVY